MREPGWKDSDGAPYRGSYAITPHATDDIGPVAPRAILATGAGTVAMRLFDSDADITVTFAAHEIKPLVARHIRVSGTSATGLIALY